MMYKKQGQDSSPLVEDPHSSGSCPEVNGSHSFTTKSHIHPKQADSAFTFNSSPITNGSFRQIQHGNFPRQLATATTAHKPGLTSPSGQSALGSQMRASPQKQGLLPGLGQIGDAYRPFSVSTPASRYHEAAGIHDVFRTTARRASPVGPKCGYAEILEKFGCLSTKKEIKPDIATQQLQPERDIMEDLRRLLKREIDAPPRAYAPASTAFEHSQSLPLIPSQLEPSPTTSPDKSPSIISSPSNSVSPIKVSGTSMYQYAAGAMHLPFKTVSPTKLTSPSPTSTKFNAPAQTPTRFNEQIHTPTKSTGQPYTPKRSNFPTTSKQSTGKSKGRHHRTATPEQRTIREMMGGKPVFTVGMKEQNDRCLFYDFFEQIKQWAANYTVNLRSLNAEQVHGLASHHLIAGPLGEPTQLTMLITERDMLNVMVTSIVCRHIVKYALDEHSLHESAHPQAAACEELAYRWSLLSANDYSAKHDLLLSQQQIYTAIKDAPDHRDWRAATSSHLAFSLLSSLSNLLATNLAPAALTERNHTLTELYVKGYRIGFRLRMAANWWSFAWPTAGAEFDPAAMVNENRMLYGDILTTMKAVMNAPAAHEVRFAMSPTVAKSGFADGVEEREVAHHAMVNITRKGCV